MSKLYQTKCSHTVVFFGASGKFKREGTKCFPFPLVFPISPFVWPVMHLWHSGIGVGP